MSFLKSYHNFTEFVQHFGTYSLGYFQSLLLGFDPIIEKQDAIKLLPYLMSQDINYRYIIFIISNLILFIDPLVKIYFKPDNVAEEDLWLFHQFAYPVVGYNQQVKVMFTLGYVYLFGTFIFLTKEKRYRKRDICIAYDGKLMKLHNQMYFPTILARKLLKFRQK